ncbi:translation initiation factor IF-2-like [Onychostruthus taczanowskii]|uniref:translation initiation factor IF-2-like n=1 Tax=Onychostruthus taczanowskii TaxID=356909 RepID=UPI001B801F4A|nr:translation initiation factor IF-2-like [Onychostruthus taczanowskii]
MPRQRGARPRSPTTLRFLSCQRPSTPACLGLARLRPPAAPRPGPRFAAASLGHRPLKSCAPFRGWDSEEGRPLRCQPREEPPPCPGEPRAPPRPALPPSTTAIAPGCGGHRGGTPGGTPRPRSPTCRTQGSPGRQRRMRQRIHPGLQSLTTNSKDAAKRRAERRGPRGAGSSPGRGWGPGARSPPRLGRSAGPAQAAAPPERDPAHGSGQRSLGRALATDAKPHSAAGNQVSDRLRHAGASLIMPRLRGEVAQGSPAPAAAPGPVAARAVPPPPARLIASSSSSSAQAGAVPLPDTRLQSQHEPGAAGGASHAGAQPHEPTPRTQPHESSPDSTAQPHEPSPGSITQPHEPSPGRR